MARPLLVCVPLAERGRRADVNRELVREEGSGPPTGPTGVEQVLRIFMSLVPGTT